MVGRLSAARAGFLAAVILLVHGGPGAALRLLLAHAAILVALFDVVGFALLLGRIRALVASRHSILPDSEGPSPRAGPSQSACRTRLGASTLRAAIDARARGAELHHSRIRLPEQRPMLCVSALFLLMQAATIPASAAAPATAARNPAFARDGR